jgi:hypothetical protein
MNLTNKCYMCDEAGVTREHVPPLSFFPSGHRMNLVTVPSCHEHNSKNSKDVEYVRNIIVSHLDTNSVARALFKDKILRSYSRSPKLKQRTFEKRMPVIVQGYDSVIVELDMPRFKLVMKAIAYAVYFKDFGKSSDGDWLIYSPSMVATKPIAQGLPDPVNPEIRALFRAVPFIQRTTANPKVFKYAAYDDNGKAVVYKFEFYEGFVVHAVDIIHPTEK